jgi:hypothetical protein
LEEQKSILIFHRSDILTNLTNPVQEMSCSEERFLLVGILFGVQEQYKKWVLPSLGSSS